MTEAELATCRRLSPALTWDYCSTVVRCGTGWLTVRDMDDPGKLLRITDPGQLAAFADAAATCAASAEAGQDFSTLVFDPLVMGLSAGRRDAVINPCDGRGYYFIPTGHLGEIATWLSWLEGPAPDAADEPPARVRTHAVKDGSIVLRLYDELNQYRTLRLVDAEQLLGAFLVCLGGGGGRVLDLARGQTLAIYRRSGAFMLSYHYDALEIAQTIDLTAPELALAAIRLATLAA